MPCDGDKPGGPGREAPAWKLAIAAAVLGISIGLSNIGTRIAADLNLVRVANADDASTNVFDTDSGLRP